MASKQVRDECKVGESIVAAGSAWACEIGARRAGQLAQLGLGGAQVEAAICQGIERDMAALAARGQRLQDADIALDVAESTGPGVLARRDEACQRTYNGLVLLREVVTAVAGDGAARELGFVGTTPRDPVAVEELAGRVLGRVATVKLTPTMAGVTLDLGAATQPLAAEHPALVQGNADVLEAKRREQFARARREELWVEYTRERTCTAWRLDADLRAVGLTDVADRLVPAVRKATPAVDAAEGAKDGAKVSLKRPEKAPAKGDAAKTEATKAAEKPAEPAVTPAINTRPSLPPASPS